MSASIVLPLRPFNIPNFVVAEFSGREVAVDAKGIPLSELDANALSEMCDEFREGVFKKAGTADPRASETKKPEDKHLLEYYWKDVSLWRCKYCHAPCNPASLDWRWNGEQWQHRHEDVWVSGKRKQP